MVKVETIAQTAAAPSTTARPSLPTTQEFAALHDHARLPSRFWGRFTTTPGTRFG